MGLGGDDSWTRSVHKRFLVRPGRFDFGLRIHALPAGADADNVYRRAFCGTAKGREGGGSRPAQAPLERKATQAAASAVAGSGNGGGGKGIIV